MLKHLAGKEEVLGVVAGSMVLMIVGVGIRPEITCEEIVLVLLKAQIMRYEVSHLWCHLRQWKKTFVS